MDIPVCLTICLWKDIWFFPLFWLLQIKLVCYRDINVATPFFFNHCLHGIFFSTLVFQTVYIIIFEVDFLWIVYSWIMFAFEKIHYAHLCLFNCSINVKNLNTSWILFWLTWSVFECISFYRWIFSGFLDVTLYIHNLSQSTGIYILVFAQNLPAFKVPFPPCF